MHGSSHIHWMLFSIHSGKWPFNSFKGHISCIMMWICVLVPSIDMYWLLLWTISYVWVDSGPSSYFKEARRMAVNSPCSVVLAWPLAWQAPLALDRTWKCLVSLKTSNFKEKHDLILCIVRMWQRQIMSLQKRHDYAFFPIIRNERCSLACLA